MTEETKEKAPRRLGRARSAALFVVVLCLAVLWLASRPVDRMSALAQEPGARGWAQGPGVPVADSEPHLRGAGGWAGTLQGTNGRLIEMLKGEDTDGATAAADELLKRDLSAQELDQIRRIVERVPFRDYGCMRPSGDPSNASGSHAWKVLEAKLLPRLSQGKQIEWLVGWFSVGKPFGQSAADAATRPLVTLGAAAVPGVSAVLAGGEAYPQLWAGRTLVDIGTDKSFAAVEKWALPTVEKSRDPLVYGVAAHWLGLLQSKAGFEPLVRLMWAHLGEAGAWELVGAVQDTGWERAIPELAKVVEATPARVDARNWAQTRLWAGQALAELGDERGRTALRDAATSPNVAMRCEAPYHLVCLGRAEARPLLERLAKDADQTTALRAQDRLKALGTDAKTPAAEQPLSGTMRLMAKQREHHTRWAKEHGG